MKRLETSSKKKEKLKIRDVKKNSSVEVGHVINKFKSRERQLTIVVVIIILILLCVSLYITFSSILKKEYHSNLKTGTLVIDYNEDETGVGDIVTLYSDDSKTDSKGINGVPYRFKITNDSNKDVQYEIILEDDTDMFEIDKCQNIRKENIRFSLNDSKVKSLSSIYDNDKYILKVDEVKKKSSKSYKLNIWVSKQEKSKSKHYHGKIVIREIGKK